MAGKTGKTRKKPGTSGVYSYDGNAAKKPSFAETKKSAQPKSPKSANTAGQKKASASKTPKRKVRTPHQMQVRSLRQYVVFLVVIILFIILTCVEYLRLKTRYMTQVHLIETLETELVNLRSENDAMYDSVYAGVNLKEVRDIAVNDLGMHYPTPEQIVWYTTSTDEALHMYGGETP